MIRLHLTSYSSTAMARLGLFALLVLLCGHLLADIDFPVLTGQVVDQAGLLSTEEEAALTSRLEDHEAETTNQIVVVTVSSLQGNTINDFTNQLARHWGIGQAGKDNGIVLLVAPEQRKVRIEVGYGLEGTLTDAQSSDIINRHILPSFRESEYSNGISSGVDNILAALKGEYVMPQKNSDKNPLARYFPLLFILAIMVSELLSKFGHAVNRNAVFPAAFIGIFITAFKENLMLGIVGAVAAFIVLHWLSKRSSSRSGHNANALRDEEKRYNQSRNDSGGFSGGGGSFGGGGASGSW